MKKNLLDFIGDKLIYLNGGMYSTENDPNFLVSKEPPGVGWNVNFGNPKAVRSFILTILIIIGLVVASIELN